MDTGKQVQAEDPWWYPDSIDGGGRAVPDIFGEAYVWDIDMARGMLADL